MRLKYEQKAISCKKYNKNIFRKLFAGDVINIPVSHNIYVSVLEKNPQILSANIIFFEFNMFLSLVLLILHVFHTL